MSCKSKHVGRNVAEKCYQKTTSYKSGTILNDWQTMKRSETARSNNPSLCSCRCFSKYPVASLDGVREASVGPRRVSHLEK
jgi:hypothetical protein